MPMPYKTGYVGSFGMGRSMRGSGTSELGDIEWGSGYGGGGGGGGGLELNTGYGVDDGSSYGSSYGYGVDDGSSSGGGVIKVPLDRGILGPSALGKMNLRTLLKRIPRPSPTMRPRPPVDRGWYGSGPIDVPPEETADEIQDTLDSAIDPTYTEADVQATAKAERKSGIMLGLGVALGLGVVYAFFV